MYESKGGGLNSSLLDGLEKNGPVPGCELFSQPTLGDRSVPLGPKEENWKGHNYTQECTDSGAPNTF